MPSTSSMPELLPVDSHSQAVVILMAAFLGRRD
jgi:hypothetical protein